MVMLIMEMLMILMGMMLMLNMMMRIILMRIMVGIIMILKGLQVRFERCKRRESRRNGGEMHVRE